MQINPSSPPSLPLSFFLSIQQTNMTTTKAATECCMCGDHGLSCELFECKVCQFRSQHSYCSNLYPKAESYRVCNWCLTQSEKTQNSSNSSSSHKTNSEDDHKIIKTQKKNNNINHGKVKGQRGSLQLQLNKPIKKQRSPEGSPPARKRIITNGALEEKIKRTKSEEISRSGITKHVFRNKVRRYKLLDEVSS